MSFLLNAVTTPQTSTAANLRTYSSVPVDECWVAASVSGTGEVQAEIDFLVSGGGNFYTVEHLSLRSHNGFSSKCVKFGPGYPDASPGQIEAQLVSLYPGSTVSAEFFYASKPIG